MKVLILPKLKTEIPFSMKEAGPLNQVLESLDNPRNSQGKSLKIGIRQEYTCQVKKIGYSVKFEYQTNSNFLNVSMSNVIIVTF